MVKCTTLKYFYMQVLGDYCACKVRQTTRRTQPFRIFSKYLIGNKRVNEVSYSG